MKLNYTLSLIITVSLMASFDSIAQENNQNLSRKQRKLLENQQKLDSAAQSLQGKNGSIVVDIKKKGTYQINGESRSFKKGKVTLRNSVRTETQNVQVSEAQTIKGTPEKKEYIAVEERTGAKSYGKEEKDRSKFGTNKDLQNQLANARANKQDILNYKGKEYRAGVTKVTPGTPDQNIPAQFRSETKTVENLSANQVDGNQSGRNRGKRIARTRLPSNENAGGFFNGGKKYNSRTTHKTTQRYR